MQTWPSYSKLRKRALAMRLFWLLVPAPLSQNLPRWLFDPVIFYWVFIPPDYPWPDWYKDFPPFIPPIYTVPPGGLPPGASFPPGSIINQIFVPIPLPTGGEPTPPGTIIINLNQPFIPPAAGTALPPGTQIRPIYGPGMPTSPTDPGTVPGGNFSTFIGPVSDFYPPSVNSLDDAFSDINSIFQQYIDDSLFNPSDKDQSKPTVSKSFISAPAVSSCSLETGPQTTWAAAHDATNAAYVYDSDEPVQIAYSVYLPPDTYAVTRGAFLFTVPAAGGSGSFDLGYFIIKATGANTTVSAQACTGDNPANPAVFSNFFGDPTAGVEKDADNVVTIPLNSDILAFINANQGNNIIIMTRCAPYDVANLAPAGGTFGSMLAHGIYASDPDDVPYLNLRS